MARSHVNAGSRGHSNEALNLTAPAVRGRRRLTPVR
jgi:hypothetical protein